MSDTDHYGKWKGLRDDLKQRMIVPARDPTFVLYFLVIVLAGGGLGCWITIPHGVHSEILTSFSTYAIAVLAASMADVVLAKDGKQSFKMVAIGTVVFGGTAAVIGIVIGTANLKLSYLCSVVSILLSWFLWYVANADNERLQDRPAPPSATTGGDPASKLEGNLGSLNL